MSAEGSPNVHIKFCLNEPQIPDMVNSSGDHWQHAYNTKEHAVINVHKVTYLQATSLAERKQIAKEVLADLFNHWSQKGLLFTEVDMTIRTKVFLISISIAIPFSVPKSLVAWIQKNWRSHCISQKKVVGWKWKYQRFYGKLNKQMSLLRLKLFSTSNWQMQVHLVGSISVCQP